MRHQLGSSSRCLGFLQQDGRDRGTCRLASFITHDSSIPRIRPSPKERRSIRSGLSVLKRGAMTGIRHGLTLLHHLPHQLTSTMMWPTRTTIYFSCKSTNTMAGNDALARRPSRRPRHRRRYGSHKTIRTRCLGLSTLAITANHVKLAVGGRCI